MIVRKYPDRAGHHRRCAQNGVFNLWGSWLAQRQLGCPPTLGLRDRLYRDTYAAILPVSNWDQSLSKHSYHGGVFNLEFSPDGRILVAACERKSILVFDPLTEKLINHLDHAHNDNVNCVRFLDSRMFATGSDDMTVALWDVRYLKHRIRSLRGHSYWVKNIEYASAARLLVTSGFDGSIYTWDINRYTEDVQFTRVFHTDGLMRTKLTPDESKLVICTTTGYLMVVNDLDLASLASDLQGFNPNMYRLMQLSSTPIPAGCSFNHVFTSKHNRVELVSDFPQGNDAEIISSLQIHPQGWCALSRNTSSDNNSEWTCVHDIQDLGKSDMSAILDEDGSDREGTRSLPSSHFVDMPGLSGDMGGMSSARDRGAAQTENSAQRTFNRPVLHIRFNCRSSGRDNAGGGEEAAASDRREPGDHAAAAGVAPEGLGSIEVQLATPDMLEFLASTRRTVELTPSQLVSALSGGTVNAPSSSRRNDSERSGDDNRESRLNEDDDDDGVVVEDGDDDDDDSSDDQSGRRLRLDFEEHPALFIRAVSQLASRTMGLLGAPAERPVASNGDSMVNDGNVSLGSAENSNSDEDPAAKMRRVFRNLKIHRNRRRLTHYAEELNVGRGFIKELCFSTDGRLVCSPYGHGVRLLAFDSDCRELCDVAALGVGDKSTCQNHHHLPPPRKLHDISTSLCHANVTVSTKFSPTHCLLVSGCLNGKICFHRPVLS